MWRDLDSQTQHVNVDVEEKPQKLKLKRELGMLGAVSLIVGTAVGSGIFMTPQTVISSIGSPGASLVIWASCGLLAILASFCYAELGTVIKESGGEYIYIVRTSGPALAFMFIFSSVLLVRPAGIAGIGLSFATYVVTPFYGDCPPPVLVVKYAQVCKCNTTSDNKDQVKKNMITFIFFFLLLRNIVHVSHCYVFKRL
uniref:Zmp:0000001267 n=1 Tax=Neolamprologus brichardi TaxID=32507 RepID=A0A3Q4HAL5_NEOBR